MKNNSPKKNYHIRDILYLSVISFLVFIMSAKDEAATKTMERRQNKYDSTIKVLTPKADAYDSEQVLVGKSKKHIEWEIHRKDSLEKIRTKQTSERTEQ